MVGKVTKSERIDQKKDHILILNGSDRVLKLVRSKLKSAFRKKEDLFLTYMTTHKTKNPSTSSFNFLVDWKGCCHNTEYYTGKVQNTNP